MKYQAKKFINNCKINDYVRLGSMFTLTSMLCLLCVACDGDQQKPNQGGTSGINAGEAGIESGMDAGSAGGEGATEAGISMGGGGMMLMPDMTIPDMEMDMEVDMEVDMMPEPDMEVIPECANGQDDDGDGLIDYPRDPGCTGPNGELEADPELFACEDEIDNDEDGFIDLADSACSSPKDPSEEGSCLGHEGIDVSDVPHSVYDSEGNPALLDTCRNNNASEMLFLFTLRTPVETLVFDTFGSGFDTLMSVRRDCLGIGSEIACNDDAGNGRTSAVVFDRPALGDYIIVVDGYGEESGTVVLNIEGRLAEGDPCPPENGVILCPAGHACNDEGVCAPALCSDTEDNDADDLIDYPNDPGCESPEDQSEENELASTQCSDFEDNDGDMLIDFPNDPQCVSAADNREATDPQCSDGRDNDQDGLIDAFDPGCEGEDDTSEYNLPACRDEIDNDGDGKIDFPNDPGCLYGDDASERTPNPAPQCGDGVDNDGDGLTDYPEDENSCSSASDPTEDNPCTRREIRDITGQQSARGNTEGDPNDFRASCGGSTGSDEVIVWRVEEDRPLSSLSITSTNSNISVVLSARSSCDGAVGEELGCGASTAFIPLVIGPRAVGEDVYLFVDARMATGGIWRLQFDAQLEDGARCDGPLTWNCKEGSSCLEQLDGSSRCVVPQCSDGIDNNEDGRIDYPNDPGCENDIDNLERTPNELPECANDIDDDGDGLFDFGEDPDCDSASDIREAPECRDGLDNDGDGRTDFEGFGRSDLGCSCPDDPEEDRENPACSDGCDNDGDGMIDAEDPGCLSPNDINEYNDPACRDGRDNDGDNLTDFPHDPGCESPDDLHEIDPDPKPLCGNGVDDDDDGLIDYPADEGCSAASDPSEESNCDLEVSLLPAEGTVTGDTSTQMSYQTGTCSAGNAPEAIWRVALNHPATLTLDTLGEGTGANFATVLYARNRCRATLPCPVDEPNCIPESSELSCAFDPEGGGATSLSVAVEAGETYLFVDGLNDQSGTYELTVRGEYPIGGPCDESLSYVTCAEGSICVSPAEGEPTICAVACRDRLDNDEDDLIDFPHDPGCESPDDQDEVDPDPKPLCGNGVDDDDDGLIDYPADEGCSAASDPSEESNCDLEVSLLPAEGTVTGDTSTQMSYQTGTCSAGNAPEAIWRVALNHPATLTLDTLGEGTGANFATVLYARNRCRATLPCPVDEPNCIPESSELSCAFDPEGGGATSLSVAVEAGETYLFVDGLNDQSGTYELTVRGEYPIDGPCDESLSYVTCPEGSVCVSPTEGEPTICVIVACRDGFDNDEDNLIDFPHDPGCESLDDLYEIDPDPKPLCGNGVDDDDDGLIDYPADEGCSAASDPSEESNCDLEVSLLPAEGTVTGDTSTLMSYQTGTCSAGNAPEAIWRVVLNHPATLTLDTLGEGTEANFATVLYARNRCRATLPCPVDEPNCIPESSELSCAFDPEGGGATSLSVAVEAGETYLFVDGLNDQSGTYELTVRGEYPIDGPCDESLSYVTCPEGSVCVSPTEGEPTICVVAP